MAEDRPCFRVDAQFFERAQIGPGADAVRPFWNEDTAPNVISILHLAAQCVDPSSNES